MKIHIVQKGDTLWKLAKKYGVSYEQLKKSNSQLSNPDMMMPGMKINIPGSTSGTIKKEMGSPQVNYQSKETQISPMQMKEQQIKPQPVIKEQQKYQPPVKEQQIVQQPKIKEYQQPIKEYQQPIIKEKQIIVPKEVQVPTPVVPEIDINNYYMVNMTNMNVQKPTPPAPPKKVEPVVEKKVEKPVKKKTKKKPVVQEICQPVDDCIPITPIMPGGGSMIDPPPWAYMPIQGVQGVQNYQGMQGYQMMEESSDIWGESTDMYMMNPNQIQGAGTNQAGQQYYPYQASAPVPYQMYGGPTQQVAGAYMMQQESSSESSSSSSSSHHHKFQVYPTQAINMPQMQEEEDCGCNSGVIGTYGPDKGGKSKYASDDVQTQAHHHPDYHQFHKGRPQQQFVGAYAEASYQNVTGEGQQQPIQYQEESVEDIQVQNLQVGQPPGGMMGAPSGNQMGGMMNNYPGNQMGNMMGAPSGNQMGGMMNNHPGNQMGNMMGAPSGNQMGGMMNNHPGNQMGNMMGAPSGNQMGGMMNNHSGNQMGNMMGNPYGNQMGNMMGNPYGNQMGNMMGNPYGNQMGNMMGSQPGMMPGQFGGQPGMMRGQIGGNPEAMMPGQMGGQPGQFGGVRAPETFGMPTYADESDDY